MFGPSQPKKNNERISYLGLSILKLKKDTISTEMMVIVTPQALPNASQEKRIVILKLKMTV